MKRTVSLILVLTIICSMLPGIYASDAAEAAMKYVFSASAYGSETGVLVEELKGYDDAETPVWANIGTDPWRVDGKEYLNNCVLSADEPLTGSYIRSLPNVLTISYWKTRAWQNGVNKRTSIFAVLLNIDETGSFTPVLTYEGNPKSCIWDVYLIPKSDVDGTNYKDKFDFADNGQESRYIENLDAELKESYKIGSLDTYAPSSVTKTAYFKTYNIESVGEYYLFMQCNGINPAAYADSSSWFATNLFMLEMYKKGDIAVPKLHTVNVELGAESVPQSKTTEVKVSFLLDNGDKPVEEYKYTLESSDTSVATVDAATGTVTAINPGETKIIASVETDNGVVTGSATLTVTEKPYLKEFKFSKKSLALFLGYDANSSEKISYTAVMSDGEEIDASIYSPVVESFDEAVAKIDAETGIIAALSCGKTTVKVSAQNEKGELCEGVLSVEVREREDGLSYKFSSGAYGLESEITRDELGHLDLDEEYAYINTDPWRVDGHTYIDTYLAATPSEIPKTDTYAAYKKANALSWRHGKNRAWNGTTEKKTSAIAIVLDVQKVGSFTPAMTYEARPTACIYDVYFVPKTVVDATNYKDSFTFVSSINADGSPVFGYSGKGTIGQYINSVMTEEQREKYFIGKLDMYGAESSTRTTVFNNVDVDAAGEYYLLLQCNGVNEAIQGDSKGYIYGNLYSFDMYFIPDTQLVSTGALSSKSELLAGDTATLTAQPKIESGRIINTPAVITTMTSENEDVAIVDGTTLITYRDGTARIRIESHLNGDDNIITGYLDIVVEPEGMTDIEITAGGSPRARLTDVNEDAAPVYIKALSNVGRELDATNAEISVVSKTPELAYITEDMQIIPVSEGDAVFEVTAELGGRTLTKIITLPVVRAKSKSSYMTEEKAVTARENVQKYDWAKSTAERYIKSADKYVDKLDVLWDMIHSEGLPRGYIVGHGNDADAYKCRYCNIDLRAKYGSYSWEHNALSRPWKIQCPDCKRFFPSNDFESFYKLGINEYGEFDQQRALDKHAELFGDKNAEVGSEAWYGYGVKGGYLYNELYDNLADVKSINGGKGLREGERQETWGVDDGFGYVPKKPDGTPYSYDGIVERHTYIAEYLFWGIWRNGAIGDAIEDCAYAYFYTGDKKYGRVAAILLDRLADFFPEYDTSPYENIAETNGSQNYGKIVGSIWDTEFVSKFITAYDMVFDLYDDEYVVNYIRDKASKYKMYYAKETPSQIRTNIEDGLIRSTFEGVKSWLISGNYGMEQKTTAVAAVVLDSHPESDEWIDFMMATGWDVRPEKTGGSVSAQLVDDVDADGHGDEGSTYNTYWLDNMREINEVFESNDDYSERNLKNQPKFIRMHYANIPLMSTYYSPKIGDSGSTAGKGHWISSEEALDGWKLTGDPIFAQILYLLNGNSVEGLRYSITERNPERLETEVQSVIDEHGRFKIESEMMTNFGFGMLRSGGDYTDGAGQTAQETRRDVWMYFGTNGGHAHKDTLNLGLTAFGLNFMPDLGYPEQTGTQPNRLQWVRSTTSHNTVVVDEDDQLAKEEVRGKAKHFDDDGTVALMDVSAAYTYNSADEYRRSVIQIDVDDENSYVVDFFRVLGGFDHLYSFHASSNEINSVSGLELVSQMENGEYKGSYAGIDVPYGPDPNSPLAWNYTTDYPRGYTWLCNVDRDDSPENKFEVDFAIKDFNKAVSDSKGLALHFTMHNDSNAKDGVTISASIADGLPPQKADNKNIDKLKYLLVKHTGEELDTVFTSVIEPYRTARYLKTSEELEMRVAGDAAENAGDARRALRVEHESGRVDYILYATNNDVTYEITMDNEKTLRFRGFIGVYSVNQAGESIYRYICDGDILGEEMETSGAIEGTVKTFSKGEELLFENEITVTPNETIELTAEQLEDIEGRYVYVNNGETTRSGAFKIESAKQVDGDIILDIGLVTPVRKYIDSKDFSKGFEYMISEGQAARIPLSFSFDAAPAFDEIADNLSTSAGSALNVAVKAHSPIDSAIKYKAGIIPRGATIDEETGVITWKPTSSQIGENHFAITAVDSDGRESTVHFYVTVYGSTSSAGGGTSGRGSAGGGGGGGTSGPAGGDNGSAGGDSAESSGQDSTTQNPEDTTTEPSTPDTPSTDSGSTGSGDTSDVGFADLDSHAWAEESINALAEEGIIKGTSGRTYSPAANITRADFAILLVRAFELESENSENFADVADSDYFASELAVARNTGIVNGIGDNKYAPRNTITRQDMMTIVYRALNALEIELTNGDVDYADFDSVAEYAKEAVKALITSGLVNGKSGKIAPNDYTTRAEVAVLLKRILDHIAK